MDIGACTASETLKEIIHEFALKVTHEPGTNSSFHHGGHPSAGGCAAAPPLAAPTVIGWLFTGAP